jgi:type IV pilus assembly protein PilB
VAKLERPMDGGRKPIGQILLEQGVITQADLAKALRRQKESGGTIGQALVDSGACSADDILNALGEQADMDIVTLDDSFTIPEDVVKAVDGSIARVFKIMPIEFEGEDQKMLVVAISDPQNIFAIDDLRIMLNKGIKPVLAPEASIEAAIEKYYQQDEKGMKDVLAEVAPEDLEVLEDADEANIDDQKKLSEAPPVIRLVNLLLLSAIRDQASDIHFEPYENAFRVRYRLDGTLKEMTPPPKSLANALISRIKVMAQMDIAERRMPQDNRIMLSIGGRPVDLRVSTIPTVHGESVVMRVLDRSVVSLDLDRIGLRDDEQQYLNDLIQMPNGIVLVTGPTGSGKTTTLYSMLNRANDETIKIITTEDPVEYDLDGIVQVPINEEIGVGYVQCLRSILRQDPDKILVGEIRDRETADIAIQASLTGHLVFSTLHTNDAPGTITRLLDMGLEPFLVANTLECIIAQRLIRLICVKCKMPYEPTEEDFTKIGLSAEQAASHKFYYGKGCDVCSEIGYKGRNAIFEIMHIDSQIRELIVKQSSTDSVRAAAMQAGLRTLRESGILKILDGLTTIEEIVRETMAFG